MKLTITITTKGYMSNEDLVKLAEHVAKDIGSNPDGSYNTGEFLKPMQIGGAKWEWELDEID